MAIAYTGPKHIDKDKPVNYGVFNNEELKRAIEETVESYTAGDNVTITGKVISATDTTYSAATASALGLVKQGAAVADAAGANPTAAEFKALLDSLRTAGIIASA